MLHRLSRLFTSASKPVLFNDWKIIRGDTVEVISGKDKGKRGTIKEVKRKFNKVVVTGVNIVRLIQKIKHIKQPQTLDSGRIQKEFPIHVSNVMLIDPETK
jgi:large subunit ribosomal protein L24